MKNSIIVFSALFVMTAGFSQDLWERKRPEAYDTVPTKLAHYKSFYLGHGTTEKQAQ